MSLNGPWRLSRLAWRHSVADARTTTLLDQLNDPVLFVTRDARIVDANRKAEEFYGYSRDELLKLTVYDIRRKEDHSHVKRLADGSFDGPHVFRIHHVRRDGTVVPVEVSTRYVAEEGVFISIVRDITERCHAEERIRSLNRLLRTRAAVDEAILRERDPEKLLQAVCANAVRAGELHGALIGIAQPDGRITIGPTAGSTPSYLDDEALRWDTGPLAEGPGGTSVRERRTVAVSDSAREPRLASHRCGAVSGVRSLACSPIPMRDRVFGFLAFLAAEPGMFEGETLELMDMLGADLGFALQVIEDRARHEEERSRADRARQQLAAERDALVRRLGLQFERMPIGCFVTDQSDRVIAWNRAAERIFGYSRADVLGREIIQMIVPEQDVGAIRSLLSQLNENDETIENVNENITKDGAAIQCHWTNVALKDETGRWLGRMQMVQDITAHRRLEEELRHAQKMEAVGRLAGGVAHDFNNILTVILGNCAEALDALPPDHPQRANVGDIEQAAERAAALTRQLLAFSRRQIMQPEPLNLNQVVEKTTAMLRRVIGADITLVTKLDPHPAPVLADPGQVEQILFNLCINASDAMPAGGTLTIETARLEVGSAERVRDPLMSEGPHFCVTVRDTGVGIAEDVQPHLFEPFFTTKEAGKGTGLGLPTVYGIVRQSKGGIFFDTTPDQGTAFTVAFPVIAADPEIVTHSTPGAATTPDGVGCVLVAEDEPAVRSLTRRALATAGYTVLEASCGEEALSVAAAHHGDIDVLVTDVVMPGMGGPELAARMRQLRPDVRVLYTSGYSEALARRSFSPDEEVAFLQKPFTLAEIRAHVKDLLQS